LPNLTLTEKLLYTLKNKYKLILKLRFNLPIAKNVREYRTTNRKDRHKNVARNKLINEYHNSVDLQLSKNNEQLCITQVFGGVVYGV
jgi:hypothetical protein